MALCILILFATLAQTRLVIMSPKSLKDKFTDGEIKASYANFGFIPYGH